MIRRKISDEAGARSDGLMVVSLMFIAAFTYIALTTNPVYAGIGVGDRVPSLAITLHVQLLQMYQSSS